MVGLPLDQGQARARLAPAHHEDTLQTTIDWYREHAPARLKAPGARQPLPLRAAGFGLRTAAGVLRSFAP